MSDTFQLKPPPERRGEQHRCTACKARFEVAHFGDPLETTVEVEVRCPHCGKTHTVGVPRGTEGDLLVERLPGMEADETGGGD